MAIGSATFSGKGNLLDNRIEGVATAANKLDGGAGNDTLIGGSANDNLLGGDGNDSLAAGTGNDTVDGGNGNDVVQLAGNISDYHIARLNPADTQLVSEALGITLTARNVESFSFDDRMYSLAEVQFGLFSSGNDRILGTDDADTLAGGLGNDTMLGGAGNDIYIVEQSGDVVTEIANEGFDTVRAALASYILKDNLEGLEYTGTGAFTGTGNSLDNVLKGGAGNDKLSGMAGNDTLAGNGGTDRLDGGAGDDTAVVLGNLADYKIVRVSATDTQLANVITYETVTLTGIESMKFADVGTLAMSAVLTNVVSAYGDNLVGGSGADTLDGLKGNDTMAGMDGDDTYVVDSAGDVVVEAANAGNDLVKAAMSSGLYILGANIEAGIVTGTGAAGIIGNDLGNTLTGNSATNVLNGGAGNDIIDGKGGADKMAGGFGDDTYNVDVASDTVTELPGEGTDTVLSSATSYTLSANVENLTYTGSLAFKGTGNALENILTGSTGNDSLSGMAGSDKLFGGAGNDTLMGGDGNDILNVGAGIDIADGGAGDDTVAVLGNFADYTRSRTSLTDTLLVNPSTGESVTLRGVEKVLFADGAKTLADIQLNVKSPLNDVLTGSNLADTMDGGLGADTLQGGSGDDTYIVDQAGDMADEAPANGHDTVQVAFTKAGIYTLGVNVEDSVVTAASSLAVGITGNALDNRLVGNAGVNALTGGLGNDTLDGGVGADKLAGGQGDDVYYVDNAADSVTELANEGVDRVITTLTKYTLAANVEELVYSGTAGFAGTGNTLDNTITGGSGNDTLLGGDGNDVLRFGAGHDIVDGGAGNDVVELTGNIIGYATTRVNNTDLMLTNTQTGDSVTLHNVESVHFNDGDLTTAQLAMNVSSNFNDNLVGTAGDDQLDGGAGADTMAGLGGNDVYWVDNKSDVVIEQSAGGDDLVMVNIVANGITYQLPANVEGAQVYSNAAVNLTGNGADNSLVGNAANNSLLGGAGNDYLDGRTGNDTMDGGSGNDTLNGGSGLDKMSGGAGDDTYYVDSTGDVVMEVAEEGIDSVISSATSFALPNGIENLTSIGAAPFKGIGNLLDNHLTGGTADDTLFGGGGNDVLDGRGGKDTMDGGDGDDVYYVDSLADVVLEQSSAGTDKVLTSLEAYTLGANIERLQYGGVNSFVGAGNALDNTLVGGVGNDTLAGGDGSDLLCGGGGKDVIDGGAGNDILEVSGRFKDYTYSLSTNSNLHLMSSITGESLTVQNIESVRFQDGLWSTADIAKTISSGVHLIGTAAHDLLDGGSGADMMEGLAGDDTYVVNNLGDTVVEQAESGHDIVSLQIVGDDITYALPSQVEDAEIFGASRINLVGNALDNRLFGNDANNQMSGGAGDDTLDGFSGADTMAGGDGDDVYFVDQPGDVVVENVSAGTDRVATGLVSYTLGANVEDLWSTCSAAFNGTGNDRDNVIVGGTGKNILYGLGGTDNLFGDANADMLDGGDGDDGLTGNGGDDSLFGGNGDDFFAVTQAGKVLVDGGEGDGDVLWLLESRDSYVVTIIGDNEVRLVNNAIGVDVTVSNVEVVQFGEQVVPWKSLFLNASKGDDDLSGTTDNDWLDGLAGSDTMTGFAGDDSYVVDSDGDVVVEKVHEGLDEIYTSLMSYQLPANVENLSFTTNVGVRGIGNELDNGLYGGSGDDTLEGGDGQDGIVGGGGNNVLTGGNGADTFAFIFFEGANTVTDFVAKLDCLMFYRAQMGFGNGNCVPNTVLNIDAEVLLAPTYEVAIFQQQAKSLSVEDAAEAIGSASESYAVGDRRLFVVGDGTSTAVYVFTSSDSNAQVTASELTMFVELTGLKQIEAVDIVCY
ncbi:beta strand repeat-containing protein [Pseudoduganella sp. RAF19]